MAKTRVVSIDGGGIRGVFTAVLLERLLVAVPKLLDKVDLYAGTSTGGIIALCLASGKTPTQVRDLYEKKGPEIFDDSWLDDLKDLGGLSGADYNNKNLKKFLTAEFGQAQLKDLATRVLVSSFDLDNEDPDPRKREWKAKFFHNFKGSDSDGNERVLDVAMRTSAAPTQFPSFQGYVDGGVVANNPSMAALAQLLDQRTSGGAMADLDEIVLLSLGTGTPLQFVKGQDLDWGYAQWVKPLIKLMLDGSVCIPDYQCRQLLHDRYHRLAPKFPPDVAIGSDDVKRIPELIALATAVNLQPTLDWLAANW
jgi:patatin-like phospholipase/acyl hydrolase